MATMDPLLESAMLVLISLLIIAGMVIALQHLILRILEYYSSIVFAIGTIRKKERFKIEKKKWFPSFRKVVNDE